MKGPRRETSPGFISEASRWWRTVYDHNLQANHCAEAQAWIGRRSLLVAISGGRCGPVRATWRADGVTGVRTAAGLMSPSFAELNLSDALAANEHAFCDFVGSCS